MWKVFKNLINWSLSGGKGRQPTRAFGANGIRRYCPIRPVCTGRLLGPSDCTASNSPARSGDLIGKLEFNVLALTAPKRLPSYALRAAFGGCALYRPAGLVCKGSCQPNRLTEGLTFFAV